MVRSPRQFWWFGILASLIVIQQLLGWWKERSSAVRDMGDQSRVEELIRQAKMMEQDQIHRGRLWLGDFPVYGERIETGIDNSPHSRAASTTHRIAGVVDFEDTALTVSYEFHKCDPTSPLCASSGSMIVRSSDRAICTITITLLRPPNNTDTRNDFRVTWQPPIDGSTLNEMQILNSLAGTSEVPDRVAFRRLLTAAYSQESQTHVPTATESIEKQLLRAVFAAIVRSRVLRASPLQRDCLRPCA